MGQRRFGCRGQRHCGGTSHPLVALLAHSPARISGVLSHQRRVRALHQPATAVAAAIPARAQRPVRTGGAAMMLGSYVVAWADSHALAHNDGAVLGPVLWWRSRGWAAQRLWR